MKKAIEYGFTDLTTPISSYDPAKISIGTLMTKNTGAGATDNWVGPLSIALGRPMEVTNGFSVTQPHVVQRTADIDEIYVADGAAAATNRRFQMWTYTKSTKSLAYIGFITLSAFAATALTIRGFRMVKYTYTTGTVDISGTAVTGHSTAWQTARYAPGRISVDGGVTWTDIATINNDTSITLSVAGPTVTGVSFIFEEYRIILAVTAATATQGGLFICKGVHPGLFTSAGTTIAISTNTDNIRASYWLADASTETNTIAAGLGLDAPASDTSHDCYVLNATSASTVTMYKYNIRAALTVASGKSTSAFTLSTGAFTITGTTSQTQNGIICTPAHGPSSGVKAFYFVTTTRVYRGVLTDITTGNVSWVKSDAMTEVPPGTSNTFALGNVFASIVYDSLSDYFLLLTSGATSVRWYVTKYNTTGAQIDYIMGVEIKQLDQSTESADATPLLSVDILPFTAWINNGLAYFCRVSVAAATNQIYTHPIGAHWGAAGTTLQRIITPSINTSDANKLYRMLVTQVEWIGGPELGVAHEPMRRYFRTSGISDNSGAWTLINSTGDLSSVSPGSAIQFMFEFKVIGHTCVPARIQNLTVIYEDTSMDSHYEGSVSKSNMSTNAFAFRQKTLWGGTIPNMRIQLYNAVTTANILDDTSTVHASGTWDYSTDGGSTWLAWSSSADAVGNYIRYTASSLPSSIIVRALLTQN